MTDFRTDYERRDEYVRVIEALYPPDSEYEITADIGNCFMVSAIHNAGNWRDLPSEVLAMMARLCDQYDSDVERQAENCQVTVKNTP